MQSGRPQRITNTVSFNQHFASLYAIISEPDHIGKDTVTICFGVEVTKAPTSKNKTT